MNSLAMAPILVAALILLIIILIINQDVVNWLTTG